MDTLIGCFTGEDRKSVTQKRSRRAFDAAFNLQVVRMIREQGLSVGQVCRDMNLAESAVRRSVEQFDEESAGRPDSGKPFQGPQHDGTRQEQQNHRQSPP